MPTPPKFDSLKPPTRGETITMVNGALHVPDHPIIPFIEGDGTGPDIWRGVAARLRRRGKPRPTAASARSPGSRCSPARRPRTSWTAGSPTTRSRRSTTISSAIKGPLTTPVGGGIRSLNVALRQKLDLYACVRPVRWFTGVPSPGEGAGAGGHDHLPREHRGHLRRHRVQGEDAEQAKKLIAFLIKEMGVDERSASRPRARSASSRCPRRGASG